MPACALKDKTPSPPEADWEFFLVWFGQPYVLLAKFHNVSSPRSLFARSDLELNSLPFRKGLEALTNDRGMMHENVGPVLLLDEPIPLLIVEPLHLTLRHTNNTAFLEQTN